MLITLFQYLWGGGAAPKPLGYLVATLRFLPGAQGRIASSWDVAFDQTDNALELTLTSGLDGEDVSGATCLATITTAAGAPVGFAGEPMTESEGTDGRVRYLVTVPSELALTLGGQYRAVVQVTAPSTLVGRYVQQFRVEEYLA